MQEENDEDNDEVYEHEPMQSILSKMVEDKLTKVRENEELSENEELDDEDDKDEDASER